MTLHEYNFYSLPYNGFPKKLSGTSFQQSGRRREAGGGAVPVGIPSCDADLKVCGHGHHHHEPRTTKTRAASGEATMTKAACALDVVLAFIYFPVSLSPLACA